MTDATVLLSLNFLFLWTGNSPFSSAQVPPVLFTVEELALGQAQCDQPRQGSLIYCHSRYTNSETMLLDPSTNLTRSIDSDVDPSLTSSAFYLACSWNAAKQQCEYRCNWLYEFGDTILAEKAASMRPQELYVYQRYGAACTAFNIRPSTNGNKLCSLCEDPNFNPPECNAAVKDPDCLTRCNMLPNCTTLCQHVLINGLLSNEDASVREEDAFIRCCVPMRIQINGEAERLATESCYREFFLLQGYEMTSARNQSCIRTQQKFESYPYTTPYCCTEICHFRISEQDILDSKNRWTETTMSSALAADCIGGSCGIVTSVAAEQDGELAVALADNIMLGTNPASRFRFALNTLLSLMPFDALLNIDTAKIANPLKDGETAPETVMVETILFHVYQKNCPASAPCSLQHGVLLNGLQTKYTLMFRSLLASGRWPSIVQEIIRRRYSMTTWQHTLPAYVPNVKAYNVPPFSPEVGHIPLLSAIDHFHSRQALRRMSDGNSREMESGPTVGSQRVAKCVPEPGLFCVSESGSRRMNTRRNPCLSPSLYRPDEIPYNRPEWRYELDLWISPYGELGRWVDKLMNWRMDHHIQRENLSAWLDTTFNDKI